MSFEAIPEPHPESYCDPTIFPVDLRRTLPAPPGPGIFLEERTFWSDETIDSFRDERGIGALAAMFRGAFSYHIQDAQNWGDYNRSGLNERVTHLTNYTYALATLGLSRLIREMRQTPAGFRIGSVGSKEEPDVTVDLNNVEAGGSGLHASAEYFEQYGMASPKRGAPARWYEGEDVFVRLSAPARPTKGTQLNYYTAYNTQMPLARLTSAVPRLKRGLWPAQGVIRFAQR